MNHFNTFDDLITDFVSFGAKIETSFKVLHAVRNDRQFYNKTRKPGIVNGFD